MAYVHFGALSHGQAGMSMLRQVSVNQNKLHNRNYDGSEIQTLKKWSRE